MTTMEKTSLESLSTLLKSKIEELEKIDEAKNTAKRLRKWKDKVDAVLAQSN